MGTANIDVAHRLDARAAGLGELTGHFFDQRSSDPGSSLLFGDDERRDAPGKGAVEGGDEGPGEAADQNSLLGHQQSAPLREPRHPLGDRGCRGRGPPTGSKQLRDAFGIARLCLADPQRRWFRTRFGFRFGLGLGLRGCACSGFSIGAFRRRCRRERRAFTPPRRRQIILGGRGGALLRGHRRRYEARRFLPRLELAATQIILDLGRACGEAVIAGGWNAQFKPNEKLTLELDLGYSRIKKTEENLEIYLGTGRGQNVGARETALGFEMRPNGGIMFDPSLDYADPNLFVITDPQGWNSCGGAVPNCQDGFVNTPRVKDQLKSLRLQATQELGGVISSLRVGANYSDRKKSLDDRGFVLTSKNYPANTAVPTDYLYDPVSLDFIGIPGMVAFDSWRFYNDGNYNLTDGAGFDPARVFNDYTGLRRTYPDRDQRRIFGHAARRVRRRPRNDRQRI